MQNYFAIETEAAFRRREWQQAAAADARAAQARSSNGHRRWPHLPHLVVASLRSLSAPRLPLAAPLRPEAPTPAC